MAHGAFRILDSDIHIIEPPDLWPRYIDPAFRDRAPVGLTEDEGDLRLALAGQPWGRLAINADRSKRRQGRNYALNQERWRPYAERGWTSKVQLEAMDIEGIDVAVVYPSRGLFALTIPDMEPRLAAAMARAYNDWLHEFCQENPERLLGAGMISPFDVDDAVAEARRCVREFGFRAMFLRPNEVNGRNWHDPYYEPLWAELEELEVPLGFHEGSGAQLRHVGEQFGANTLLKHVYSHPVEQMLAVGSFCAGGILERHPRLRVAFLEGNCSWVPFLLWRMDEHWEWIGDVYARDLTMAPSEYFKRQCFVSVERGQSVVCMDVNLTPASPYASMPSQATVIRGDVTRFEDVMRAVLEVKPERMINLAYGLGAGEGNPHQVMLLDVLGMDNCFEAARLGGVRRVVYASSIAVSGLQSRFGDRLVNEDDATYGTSQYAVHKTFNEFQARKFIKNYTMSITGVRPANVTGPDKVRGSVDHVQLMVDAARGKPVHLPRKGFMRLLIHVEDTAEVFARVLMADAPKYAVYNTGGVSVSLGELADIV